MLRASDIEQSRVGKLSISTSLLVRAAHKLGLAYKLLPERTVLISDGLRAHYFRGTSLPCIDMVAAAISENKQLSRKLMRLADIPTPKTIVLRNPAAWEKIRADRLSFPLVVKPVIASHGRGATLNIQHTNELREAVGRAFAFMKKAGEGDRVLVEEFFTGHDIRLFVVGNQVVSTLHRVPAYVTGDGINTIAALIRAHNIEWKSSIEFDYPLCPIPFDRETSRFLRHTKRRFSDIPAAGENVQLRWNANVSTGGRARDITAEIHPNLCALAVKAAATLQLPVAGIDMLVKDFRSPKTDQNSVVILEANAAAGIDIHELPAEGTGRPVTEHILNHIFNSPARSAFTTPLPQAQLADQARLLDTPGRQRARHQRLATAQTQSATNPINLYPPAISRLKRS